LYDGKAPITRSTTATPATNPGLWPKVVAIPADRPETGGGPAFQPDLSSALRRVGAASEALVHHILEQAMNEDRVAADQFLAAAVRCLINSP